METVRIRRRNAGVRILLVQSEAPSELVEAFVSSVKLRFSSGSEALRSLVRAFLEGRKK